MVETSAPGQATALVRDAYAQGYRKFIAVGGDGTSYEIVNGLFPSQTGRAADAGISSPGNRQFLLARLQRPRRGVRHRSAAGPALIALRCSAPDATKTGVLHYINLLSMGFSADVATLRARRFSGWGEIGYQSSIFISLARFRRRPFPLRVDGEPELDRRPCLFLTFSNSKFTGGTMMIAPKAEVNDGLIEYVRWGPIGRLGLIRNLPTLYDGTHINHPLAERRPAKRIDFELDAPVDVMVDGEVLTLHCQSLDVLPSALNVVV